MDYNKIKRRIQYLNDWERNQILESTPNGQCMDLHFYEELIIAGNIKLDINTTTIISSYCVGKTIDCYNHDCTSSINLLNNKSYNKIQLPQIWCLECNNEYNAVLSLSLRRAPPVFSDDEFNNHYCYVSAESDDSSDPLDRYKNRIIQKKKRERKRSLRNIIFDKELTQIAQYQERKKKIQIEINKYETWYNDVILNKAKDDDDDDDDDDDTD